MWNEEQGVVTERGERRNISRKDAKTQREESGNSKFGLLGSRIQYLSPFFLSAFASLRE
jgi:hypothetical protein